MEEAIRKAYMLRDELKPRIKETSGPHGSPQPGDYLCSEHELYRIERVQGERAMLEDCLTEALVDLPITELNELKPVRRRG
jgi:hypothetical protein